MPINKLRPSKRATVLLAGIVASSVGGYVTLFQGQAPVHDDTALAIKVAGPWEGRYLKAYLDTLPTKPVWTICDGDTTNVRPNQVETPEGCDKRFAQKMEKNYRPALVKCIQKWDDHPLSWRGMMLTLSWNIGTAKTCNSTAAAIVNSAVTVGVPPNYVSSCNAATAFNKAGGRTYIGLVNRREMGDATRIGEGELCVTGAIQ